MIDNETRLKLLARRKRAKNGGFRSNTEAKRRGGIAAQEKRRKALMWSVGDMVRVHVRYSAQYAPDPCGIAATGYWRITAIRHGRCYVEHVSGAAHASGICGWSNQWFDPADARVERVS